MVDTQALRGVIAANGETQISVASKIGMPFSTFYSKMRRKSFDSDDMYALRQVLRMNDRTSVEIFFADAVAQKSTRLRKEPQ